MFARKRLLVVAGLLAAVGVIAGIAIAQIPNTGIITGCYTKSGSGLRVIDAQSTNCSTKETRLDWNQQGPAGTPGTPGTPGTNGTNGKDGKDGTNGTNGTNGISGYEVVQNFGTTTVGSTAPKEIDTEAICPEGKDVLGGGGEASLLASDGTTVTGPADLIVSKPQERNGAFFRARWVVGFGKYGASFPQNEGISFRTWVICANTN